MSRASRRSRMAVLVMFVLLLVDLCGRLLPSAEFFEVLIISRVLLQSLCTAARCRVAFFYFPSPLSPS